jgi:hypothetical protein
VAAHRAAAVAVAAAAAGEKIKSERLFVVRIARGQAEKRFTMSR